MAHGDWAKARKLSESRMKSSLALWPVAGTGWLYPVVAVIAGGWLVWESIALLRRANAGMRDAALKPMKLFHWSNSYLAIVFIAAAIDPLLFG